MVTPSRVVIEEAASCPSEQGHHTCINDLYTDTVLSRARTNELKRLAAIPDTKKEIPFVIPWFKMMNSWRLNWSLPKSTRKHYKVLEIRVKVTTVFGNILEDGFIFYWFLLMNTQFWDGAWQRPNPTNCWNVLEICVKRTHHICVRFRGNGIPRAAMPCIPGQVYPRAAEAMYFFNFPLTWAVQAVGRHGVSFQRWSNSLLNYRILY